MRAKRAPADTVPLLQRTADHSTVMEEEEVIIIIIIIIIIINVIMFTSIITIQDAVQLDCKPTRCPLDRDRDVHPQQPIISSWCCTENLYSRLCIMDAGLPQRLFASMLDTGIQHVGPGMVQSICFCNVPLRSYSINPHATNSFML